jgi:hypothetical protein
MSDAITILDIIKPLWLKRYELIFSVLLVFILVSCSLYLFLEKSNYDAKKYYHQDIRFNPELSQKYFKLITDSEIVRSAYLKNGLDPFLEGIEVSLINHSSRYDAMKENVIEESAEVFVRSLNVSIDEREKSLWETYLNLDTNYFQLVLHDPNLTKIETQIIITSIINSFNNHIADRNYLNAKIIGQIAFDTSEETLLYVNNRLQYINNIINANSDKFKDINFDAVELKYKASVLMSHIYNKDPSPMLTNLAQLNQKIIQSESLKINLEDLHTKFYTDNEETNLTNTDTQLTVDSVSQLIDLGKDFSQLNNKMELIDTIYGIDLSVTSLENSIFELNSIQKLYLGNYKPISIEQIFIEAKAIVNSLNYNIRILDDHVLEQGVFVVGNSYILTNNKLEKKMIILLIISIVLIYSMLHTISIYLRRITLK